MGELSKESDETMVLCGKCITETHIIVPYQKSRILKCISILGIALPEGSPYKPVFDDAYVILFILFDKEINNLIHLILFVIQSHWRFFLFVYN